jgi:tol-pal system protein YbgF
MLTRKFTQLICLSLLTGTVSAQTSLPQGNSLEARLTRLEQQLATFRETLLDHESTLSQLQRDIQNLRGEKEVLLHTVEQVKRQQEEMFLDLDQRFRELQGGEQPAPAPTSEEEPSSKPSEPVAVKPPAKTPTPPAPTLPAPTSPPVEAPSTKAINPETATSVEEPGPASSGKTAVPTTLSGNNETQDYQTLFKVVQSGEYEKSIAGWEAFLKRYPQGEYVANAYYWLGESQAALKQYNSAIATFKTLRDKYPDHQKSAHALLKIGYIYYELKQYTDAKVVLKQVKDLYPGTATAQLAEERLRQIYRDGNN